MKKNLRKIFSSNFQIFIFRNITIITYKLKTKIFILFKNKGKRKNFSEKIFSFERFFAGNFLLFENGTVF
ncbi:hypothetical protein CVD28_18775 [Bacillus sp. M6-12]|nr:hypothetical protein CVD28_18775 [Bacillus sp. M6-12]